MLGQYYYLTKPGIVRGNLLSAIGGFFLASAGVFDWWLLIWLQLGMALVMGGSCVFNNIYDRDIDKLMKRTERRPVATGVISVQAAVIFGSALVSIGTFILLWRVNLLTALLGLLGVVMYSGVYTLSKHRTPWSTLIGTIPGAIPPVAGYTALSDRLDLTCLLLFLILVAWQMPHFFGLAIWKLKDYQAAKVPVWPAVYGVAATKLQIIAFLTVFTLCTLAMSAAGRAGWLFGGILAGYGVFWLACLLSTYRSSDDVKWSKMVFFFSLPVLPLFSLLLVIGSLLS